MRDTTGGSDISHSPTLPANKACHEAMRAGQVNFQRFVGPAVEQSTLQGLPNYFIVA
jgi:hypothetical protein